MQNAAAAGTAAALVLHLTRCGPWRRTVPESGRAGIAGHRGGGKRRHVHSFQV